jgi:hypothetical protein
MLSIRRVKSGGAIEEALFGFEIGLCIAPPLSEKRILIKDRQSDCRGSHDGREWMDAQRK